MANGPPAVPEDRTIGSERSLRARHLLSDRVARYVRSLDNGRVMDKLA